MFKDHYARINSATSCTLDRYIPPVSLTPRQMNSLQHLPAEIFGCILNLLLSQGSKECICALAVTNKAINHVTTPYLYREVTRRALGTLLQRPDLIAFVRSAVFRSGYFGGDQKEQSSARFNDGDESSIFDYVRAGIDVQTLERNKTGVAHPVSLWV
jgi:hypothetical protein